MIEDPPGALKVDETHKIHRKAAKYAILGDLLFIVLPLVVISYRRRECWKITVCDHRISGIILWLSRAIWPNHHFKVISGFAHTKPSGAEQPVFIIALIIVFSLVPPLVVLALLLSVGLIPYGLQLVQAGIFALGVIVFFLFGVNGHAQSLRFGGRQ